MRRIVDAPFPPNPGRSLPFSAAVVAGGLCFVAGQFGTDEDNRPVGDVEEQTRVALDHLAAVLEKAGTRLDFAAMNRAYRARFPHDPPARITIGIADLLFGAAVEIEAVAAMP
jgi:2-iminobutanoate/2-iminopropanoate deaminase